MKVLFICRHEAGAGSRVEKEKLCESAWAEFIELLFRVNVSRYFFQFTPNFLMCSTVIYFSGFYGIFRLGLGHPILQQECDVEIQSKFVM